jgi:hypothetical protein
LGLLESSTYPTYEFRAQLAGLDPFFGVLPLRFNGGYLAADILFFAPAAFFNLREVFPYYDIDLEKRVVRYRLNEGEEWRIYHPREAEAARAKEFFKGK